MKTEKNTPPPAYHLNRPLVLVGMMGAGKSSIGRMLAETLNLSFADSDSEIEKASGMRIADIFAQQGEAAFRTREREVIARLLQQGEAQIMAIGGGAFCDTKTHDLIRTHATTIWLKVALDDLLHRVQRNRKKRPLLADKSKKEIEQIMRDLLKSREPFYAQADMMVQTSSDAREVAVAAIIAQLQKRGIIVAKDN